MTAERIKVLLVEDDEDDYLLTRGLLGGKTANGFELTWARSYDGALEAIAACAPDVCLVDYHLGEETGVELLEALAERGYQIPAILLTGEDDRDVDLRAMEAGAADYLVKGQIDRPLLERSIRYAVQHARTLEALRASERKYRQMVETTAEGVWVLDSQLRASYVNRRLAEMLGYSVDEMVGQSVFDFVDASERKNVRERVERRKQGMIEQYESRFRRRDGTQMWGLISASPIQGANGEFIGALGMITDITERKRAERELKKSEDRYRKLVENANDIIYTLDLEGNITSVNHRLLTLTGYSPAEVIGQNVVHLLPPDELETSLANFRLKVRGEVEATTYETELIRKDGSRLAVEVNSHLLYEGGSPVGVHGVARDLTERKRAEEERDRFFDLSQDLLCMVGFDGYFKRVNPAWSTTLGFTKEELLATHYSELIHPEDDSRTAVEFAHMVEGGAVHNFENRHRCKDGSYRWLSWSATSIIGRQTIYAIARDITERRQLEEQFRQAQKMEAVGRLAGGVAHDFNNLLTVINGYSELAIESLQPEDPLRRSIQEINHAGERAAGLTRQLLAFSRRQVMQPKVLDLNSVVADMEKMLRRLIGEDIELCTVLKPGLGSIEADPGQIEQVIMNLAVNARDAMPEGGKLTIETDCVYLDREYAGQHIAVIPGPYVQLAISDTGCGMNEETRARIFEPFFTTKEPGQGTGLGLSTVYGIVKQSGGNVWVYSEVGRGTTFKVYLPTVDQQAEAYRRDAQPEESFQGTETILLAEDEEMVRRLAREVLEMYGYHVLEAPNGGAALLICERHPGTIDLLLTDVIMPGMSGRELARRLNQLRPDMKVLYMSGYTDNTVGNYHLLDPNLSFLQKPFTPVALARKVREALNAAPHATAEK